MVGWGAGSRMLSEGSAGAEGGDCGEVAASWEAVLRS